MESQKFNQMLAYLSDVFTRKSVSMQGKSINILKCREKLNFKEKLHIWCRRVKRGNLSNFSSLVEMVNKDESLIPSVCEIILDHLEILSKSFHGYFEGRQLETYEKWIINPYFFNLNYM